MTRISYSTTPDYSGLNPPKFIKTHKIFNTILIPKDIIDNPILPTDTIKIRYNNNLISQKVGLDSGTIYFYDKEYYYFYIIPGLAYNQQKQYELLLNNKLVRLNPYFDSTYSCKIIYGLIVLPNNYNYVFNNINYSIVMHDGDQIFTRILNQQNRYNYYMANTNNTLLHILNSTNTNTLYKINDNNNEVFIRSLYNKNFPLGSIDLETDQTSQSRLLLNNQAYIFNKKISIQDLPQNTYNIQILDLYNNPINITYLNNTLLNKNFFDITINSVSYNNRIGSSLPSFDRLPKPTNGLSNLVINLYPARTQFTLIGPNNFSSNFNSGYQKLHNIFPGKYTIKYKDKQDTIIVIKNDNNYFSNL